MPDMLKRWEVSPLISPEAESELSEFSSVLRQLLYNRGLKTRQAAQVFLEALAPDGTGPENMLGIPAAVERIRWAVQKGEPIAVYGDYDADGVTATALLTQALQAMGAQARGYIPNRFEEGYGLNTDALDALYDEGFRLVVTVDCGIRSPGEAEHARRLGMDLIISDHHHPGPHLPAAAAIVNPKQPGDSYPEKELAGVGLAYKLALALMADPQMARRAEAAGVHPDDFLDLVALGTVADVAPLTGENRALVRLGLKHIQYPRRQGLISLMGVAGLLDRRAPSPPHWTARKVNASHIAFILGPRLNAAGRLDTAYNALDLLSTADVQVAGKLAQHLDNQNRERQDVTRKMQTHAEEIVLAEDPEAFLLFAVHPEYNSGVVGLAASRLTERYYRPSIVGHRGETHTRASCRSIPEFHITEALDRCADLLDRHGGHAAAAGFTVRNENLPELTERLKTIAREQLAGTDLRPTLQADMEIELKDLHPEILRDLDTLEPTGHQNPAAVFVSRDVKVVQRRTVGREKAHLKLSVTDGRVTFDAIAFRKGPLYAGLPERVDLLYNFEVNEYNGRAFLQLNVRDIQPAGG